MPRILNTENSIEMFRGTSKTFDLTVTDDSGQPVDLTGATLYLTIKERMDDQLPLVQKKSSDALQIDIYDPRAGKARIYLEPGDTQNLALKPRFFDVWAILLKPEFAQMLLHGIQMTLIVALASWLLAMSLAVPLLAVRMAPSRIAQRGVMAYVSYHRNVPTLVQLMLWYFGIASLLPAALQAWLSEHNAEAVFAIIGLGLCQAAYFSEDLRSGLRSVPAGQAEAARALGQSFIGSMRHVLMPQAVRSTTPNSNSTSTTRVRTVRRRPVSA